MPISLPAKIDLPGEAGSLRGANRLLKERDVGEGENVDGLLQVDITLQQETGAGAALAAFESGEGLGEGIEGEREGCCAVDDHDLWRLGVGG